MPTSRNETAGARAERVAEWYFRLNGFLGIPSFIIHPDAVKAHPRTEADFIGVRFGCSREVIDGRVMEDHKPLVNCSISIDEPIPLFLIAEVTLNACKVNGPYTDPRKRNLDRVIERLGAVDAGERHDAARQLYAHGRWANEYAAIQMVAIGRSKNDELGKQLDGLLQITWDDVSEFVFERFKTFPAKLPTHGNPVHRQWPDFGRNFGKWYAHGRGRRTSIQARQAIQYYFDFGDCAAPSTSTVD